MILINIGDELLIGQVINTNAAFIGEKLTKAGIKLNECITIGDNETSIIENIENGFRKDSIILITGGLGPTRDDITKNAICKYFDKKLVVDGETVSWLESLFASRGMELTETNRRQAEIPEGSLALKNTLGTAPGIWIKSENKILIALPGVPFEAEKLMDEEVIPRLRETLNIQNLPYRVLQCSGISESNLSDKLSEFENNLPENIKLAYLPKPGLIRLRLGFTENGDNEEMEKYFNILKKEVAEYLITDKDIEIEEVIGKLLHKSKKKIATAESCTGGRIANLITSVPGSSEYFEGSVVAYSNAIKRNILSVREDNLKKHGAVSEMVVSDMALNVMELFDTDYSVATSGIAGPDGSTLDKPVGTVWIAVATPTRLVTKLFNFGKFSGRKQIVERAANAALNLLRIEIEKDIKR